MFIVKNETFSKSSIVMMEVIRREAKLEKQHLLKETDSGYLWNMEKIRIVTELKM